jgi:hypothetical protein
VGCTHCIHEVVKLANNTQLSSELKLLLRSSFS